MSRQGRKPAGESRASEIRSRIAIWSQTLESTRPSLRALARKLGTSHRLLAFYLNGLDEWQCSERYWEAKESANQQAGEIRARAKAENREMTMLEYIEARVLPRFIDDVESIRSAAQRGPLHRGQVKLLKLRQAGRSGSTGGLGAVLPGWPKATKALQGYCERNSAARRRNGARLGAARLG
jgi:hypothetical protein